MKEGLNFTKRAIVFNETIKVSYLWLKNNIIINKTNEKPLDF